MSSSNWDTYQLEEVIDKFIDYRGKTPNKTDSGIPLITAKVVKGGRIETPSEFIDEEEYESWMRRGIPEIGDVVLTTEAPLGEVAQILTRQKVALAQRIITLRGKRGILDNTFLKYAFLSSGMQQRLYARATGTTVIGIKSSELKKVQIDLPPLSAQRRIAAILSAFDDKIELNRQMNQTLEEMGQALFREMCVPKEGEFPDGWEWKTIGDIAENVRNTVDPTDLGIETNYIGLEHIPRKQIAIDNWGSAENISSTKYKFTRNQILFGKLRPYFHKVGIVPVDGVCSTDILVIEPKEPFFFGFLLMHCFSEELIASVDASSSGTRMPRTNWNAISRFKIALPPISILKALNDKLNPFIQKMNHNTLENITHTRLRDLLLPKFMRGELLE